MADKIDNNLINSIMGGFYGRYLESGRSIPSTPETFFCMSTGKITEDSHKKKTGGLTTFFWGGGLPLNPYQASAQNLLGFAFDPQTLHRKCAYTVSCLATPMNRPLECDFFKEFLEEWRKIRVK